MQPVYDFIDQAAAGKRPFFVWFAPLMPHAPHDPPARILEKYQGRGLDPALEKYYAMCEWTDRKIGELIDHLETRKLRDDTLIVFMADNGWMQTTAETGLRRWTRSWAPRSKRSPFEKGVRTPMIYSWKGTLSPGERDDRIGGVDLMPTLLAAAGIEPRPELPGLDLLPVLRSGEPVPRQAICGSAFLPNILDAEDPEAALTHRYCIEDSWKLILTYGGEPARLSVVNRAEEDWGPKLYDLSQDPYEQTNLAEKHPEIVERLAQTIARDWSLREREPIRSHGRGAGD
jgi:uncharacterized sulfatase